MPQILPLDYWRRRGVIGVALIDGFAFQEIDSYHCVVQQVVAALGRTPMPGPDVRQRRLHVG